MAAPLEIALIATLTLVTQPFVITFINQRFPSWEHDCKLIVANLSIIALVPIIVDILSNIRFWIKVMIMVMICVMMHAVLVFCVPKLVEPFDMRGLRVYERARRVGMRATPSPHGSRDYELSRRPSSLCFTVMS